MSEKMIILDASALLGSYSPQLSTQPQKTTPSVLQEIKSEEIKLKTEIAQLAKKIQLEKPTQKNIEKVQQAAEQTGDIALLSSTDIELLALALQEKESGKNPLIITDDYDIQNLATKLNLNYQRLREAGISALFKWVRKCIGCGKTYPMTEKIKACRVCGSKLRKRVERYKSIKTDSS